VTTTYDMGRPVQVTGFVSGANTIAYNDNGTVHTIAHDNGVLFTQAPDPNDMARPLSLGAVHGSDQLWPTEAYSYDGAGNILAIGTKSFTYDVNSRLTSASYAGQGYRGYQYDAFGNLTRVYTNATETQYIDYSTSAATNRLSAASYNNSGSLTAFGGRCYTWDPFQQLATVDTLVNPAGSCPTASPAVEWSHIYDAAGERVWSFQTTPTPRKDVYALRGPDAQVLTEFTKVGSVYTWEDYAYREGQLLGAKLSNGEKWHFDVDHLGSLRLETDSAGNPATARYHVFWPYGEEATTPSGAEPMKFTGHERDYADNANTGDDLDYMHSRYFGPLVGRFLSADPTLTLQRAVRQPQGWNRYSYVIDRPLHYTDPSGQTYILTGCASGNAKQCNQQKSLLQQALGDSYKFIAIDKSGNVTLRLSQTAFASQGTFAAGLGSLVTSDKTFRLFTGHDKFTEEGKGSFTQTQKDFWDRVTGADIHLDPSAFPEIVGGVEETADSALAHEMGHATGVLFPNAANAVNLLTMNAYYAGEGYPMTFENRYRSEHRLPLRRFYLRKGDYSPVVPSILNLFE
jgi:RHS repeat-associated protein